MGVFRNENAAALFFRDTQQQGKCSKMKQIALETSADPNAN